MLLPSELSAVSQGIQLAIAPVFLLNAVAAMIGAVAGRLSRIIDRARHVEVLIENSPDEKKLQRLTEEFQLLRRRSDLVNGCIALLILCAILIGFTIVLLFFWGDTRNQICPHRNGYFYGWRGVVFISAALFFR